MRKQTAREQLIHLQQQGVSSISQKELLNLLSREVRSNNDVRMKTGRGEWVSYGDLKQQVVQGGFSNKNLKQFLETTSKRYVEKPVKVVDVEKKEEEPKKKKVNSIRSVDIGPDGKEIKKEKISGLTREEKKELTKKRNEEKKRRKAEIKQHRFEGTKNYITGSKDETTKRGIPNLGYEDVTDYEVKRFQDIFKELREMGVLNSTILSTEVVELVKQEGVEGKKVAITKVLKAIRTGTKDVEMAKIAIKVFRGVNIFEGTESEVVEKIKKMEKEKQNKPIGQSKQSLVSAFSKVDMTKANQFDDTAVFGGMKKKKR